MPSRLVDFKIRIRGHDHLVAALHEAGGRAVDEDLAALAPGDDVGREACAGGDVVDIDTLPRKQAGGADELGPDRDRALVVEVGAGHGDAVQFGFQERDSHGGWDRKVVLSF